MSDRKTIPRIVHQDPKRGLNIVFQSDVGCVREENQDFMGYSHRGDRDVLIVADGMGGHSGGYEASRIAVANAVSHFEENSDVADPKQLLKECIEKANASVYQAAQENNLSKGMGTTIVMVLIDQNKAWLGHVGDSRIYLKRNQSLVLLTLDHSRVNRMVEHGLIKLEDADNHPMSNILERSIGHGPMIDIEIRHKELNLAKGDRLILCSDGYWGMVKDAEISNHFGIDDLERAVNTGIQTALDYGADDNTTIGAFEFLMGETASDVPDDARKELKAISDQFHQSTPQSNPTPKSLHVESHKANRRETDSKLNIPPLIWAFAAVLIIAIAASVFFLNREPPEPTQTTTSEMVISPEQKKQAAPAKPVQKESPKSRVEKTVDVDSAAKKSSSTEESTLKQNRQPIVTPKTNPSRENTGTSRPDTTIKSPPKTPKRMGKKGHQNILDASQIKRTKVNRAKLKREDSTNVEQ